MLKQQQHTETEQCANCATALLNSWHKKLHQCSEGEKAEGPDFSSFDGFHSFYKEVYPESEISLETLVRYWSQGARIDLRSGAVFLPKHQDQWDVDYRVEPSWEIPTVDEFGEPAESVSINELCDAGIGFDIISEDTGFVLKDVEWVEKDGRHVVVGQMPDELRGTCEVAGKNPSLLEPLTYEEALEFLQVVYEPDVIAKDDSLRDAAKSRAISRLMHLSDRAAEEGANSKKAKAQLLVERAYEILHNETPDNKTPNDKAFNDTTPRWHRGCVYHHFGKETMARIKASIIRYNIGEEWSYTGQWFIGQREGTTEDESMQNDRNYTKMEQWQQPGERCEGQFMESQEIEYSRTLDLFHQMYDISKKGPDGEAANRGNTEHHLYLRRCANERENRFRKLLTAINTYPLNLIPGIISDVKVRYRDNIRSNSPGPKSARINNVWCKVPLVGDEAKAELRKNPGSLKGKRVNKNVKFHRGETWHKNFLNRQHLLWLEEAAERRLGRIHLVIAGEKVIENIPTYEGMSLKMYEHHLQKKKEEKWAEETCKNSVPRGKVMAWF